MAIKTFDRSDLRSAERFLSQIMQENVPAGDFSEGTNLRDLAVRAIAATVMYLRSEVDATTVLTDINKIKEIEDESERISAMDAFASNFYLTRGGGGYAKGFVEITFSQSVYGVVPVTSRFASGDAVYFPNVSAPVAFTSDTMRKIVDNLGTVTGYVLRIPVISSLPGEEFNISARIFTAWDKFSPYITRVENITTFTGGRAEEAVEEFFGRVEESLSVRNLLTRRAINTVLPEKYPELSNIQVIEAGDVEMSRDTAPILFGGVSIHTGGSVDVYGYTGVTEVDESFLVGASVRDLSGSIDTFSDIDFDYHDVDWRGLVHVGDRLRLHSVDTGEGSIYEVIEVDSFFLRVQPLIPFREEKPQRKHDERTYTTVSVAGTALTHTGETRYTSDDIGSYVMVFDDTYGSLLEIVDVRVYVDGYGTVIDVVDPDNTLSNFSTTTQLVVRVYDKFVQYSIGNNHPAYDNKIAPRITGSVTREIRRPGSVILPSGPVYRFKDVVLQDMSLLNADPSAGGLALTTRVNRSPEVGEYRVVSSRVDYAQSMQSATYLQVGPEDSRKGLEGSLSSIVLTRATFTDTTTQFTVQDVDKSILITGAANAGNVGRYRITNVLSATSVEVLREVSDPVTTVLTLESGMSWFFDARDIYDGVTLRVVREVVEGFESVAYSVDSGQDRVVASRPLFRAPHPVYVGIHIQYQLKSTAAEDIDVEEARSALASFITEFPAFDVLNTSDIVFEFRRLYTDVGNVKSPSVSTYSLHAPDGSVLSFSTNDEIVVDASHAVTTEDAVLLAEARLHGVSGRTIKYLSYASLVEIQKV